MEAVMSEFSDLLSNYINEKNVKVYSLFKYCDLDRSTMYQIISGKRNPTSKEIFNKIAEFLHLTPFEYQRFERAYFIAKLGATTYYRRKSVEKYLVDFPRDFSCTRDQFPVNDKNTAFDNVSDCLALSAQLDLNHFLHRMLLSEANKPDGKIALLIQPDYNFLFDLLASLRPAKTLLIEHIFCMGKAGQMNEQNDLFALSYLKRILPLYFANIDYHPYYFYDDINAHYYSLNGFPCLLLTTDFAITCTSDYKTGIFYRDKTVVSMLWDVYSSYQNQCSPLFHLMNFIPENGSEFDNELYKKAPSYILQPEACLTPFISDEILNNVLCPVFSDRNHMLEQIKELLSSNRKQLDTTAIHVYFTKQGLLEFCRTGRIKEIPDNFYRPFTPKERILLLQSMLPYCVAGNYRILKKPLNQLSENLHLCVNVHSGYLLFNNQDARTLCLIINETGLLSVFMDYLENMDDSSLFTGDETAAFVQEMIENLISIQF